MTNEDYLKKLLPSYESYFNLYGELTINDYTFPATARFHSRSEKYILTKAAKIWAHETNEYTYFALENEVTPEFFQHLKDITLKHGLEQIKPHSEHMYSYVTLVLIANHLNQDTIREIRKTKFYKSYVFSFQGWMYLRIAGVDLSNGMVYTNKRGKELQLLLSNIF